MSWPLSLNVRLSAISGTAGIPLVLGLVSATYGEPLRPYWQERSIWAALSAECTAVRYIPIELSETATAPDFETFSPTPVEVSAGCCYYDICERPSAFASQRSMIANTGFEAEGHIDAPRTTARGWFTPFATRCGTRFRIKFELTYPSEFTFHAAVMAIASDPESQISNGIRLIGDGVLYAVQSDGEAETLHVSGVLPAGFYSLNATMSLDSVAGGEGDFSLRLDLAPTGVQQSSWELIKKLYR